MERIIIAVIISIVLMIVLTTKTNVGALISMLLGGLLLGLLSGLSINDTILAITDGLGSTCKNIALVIILGTILGVYLEKSHSCERIANTLIKITGQKYVGIALALAGFIIAIPIFADVGLIIMAPIVIAVAKKSNQSVIMLGTITACALMTTNQFVIPTAQPLTIITTLNIDAGQSIVVGLIVSAIIISATVIFSYMLFGRNRSENKNQNQQKENETVEIYPTFLESLIPIVLPLILIGANSIITRISTNQLIKDIFGVIGEKHIALGIGIVFAITLLNRYIKQEEKSLLISSAIKTACPIILLTCVGGSLAKITQEAGIGELLVKAMSDTSMPSVLIPFVITALIEFSTGSSSVSVIFGSTVVLPLIEAGLINPLVAFVSLNAGTNLGCHINSSYFWVFTEEFSTDVKTSLKTYCLTRNVVMSSVGLLCAFLLSIILN